MKKILTVALIGVLVLALAGAAWGAAGKQAAPNPGNWVNLVQALGLSDEQAKQMQDLQGQFHQKMQTQRNKLQDIMFELRQMQFERDPDMNKVQQMLQEANTLRTQMREEAAQNREQMRSVLTPEQQQKWNQLGPAGRGYGMMRGQARGTMGGGLGLRTGGGPGPYCPYGAGQGTGTNASTG